MREFIPYGTQQIGDADVEAVVQVLRSDFLTQGPTVPAFERSVAEYCGAPYAIAVNSATSALHLACLALDVGPGDIVWTSPITFVASANCALYCGARVDFIDVDSSTANLCPDHLAEKLERAKREGRLPKAVIPVHLCGQSCDMVRIHALSRQYGFALIEDASHAIGGRYEDEPIGNCRYSDITVFSFHPVKIITTGEGGMLLTRNAELAKRMERLRSHGITRDPAEMTRPPDGPWYYQQTVLGYNYRMTDVQAALGRSQMDRLDSFVARRHAIARRYDEKFARLPIARLERSAHGVSALHLYVVRINAAHAGCDRRKVYDHLRERGIGTNVHYIPVYAQPYYASMGFTAGYCPEAERYYAEALSLPMFSGLSAAEQDRVIGALEELLAA